MKEQKSVNERIDDNTLVFRARGKDEWALNELMSRYKPLVVRISRKYFLSSAEPSDLVQEGMIGLFKAYRGYSETSDTSFKTFATLCITRQIQQALVRDSRQKNIPMQAYLSINNQGKVLLSDGDNEDDQDDENGFYIEAQVLSPEESVLFREKLQETGKVIDKLLSPLEKRVLGSYISGHNYQEISKIMNKQPKSIDNALQRIKIKLKELKGVD